MKGKFEKYQLCRMILVNAGTNMHVPSGRITAIDPRGGAAVLGDNGVGKTTTLRILPLFFGHLPSQIIAAGHGQEAMVKFVLPTDASAIAFEYQRGSDDEADLRLAVIRRRADDPDVPFYRLYRCGFRKELFVDEGRFLSDDETQVRATAIGIQTTGKLSTSDYRSIILRTPGSSRDKDKLRRYSLEWSYGPRQLDNLDRVVAAMVKKHISFSDIVQVAVGLVQHDLGQGAERAKLTFKQGRAPIERWLRNREACVEAFKLAPSFSELEIALRDHRTAEAGLRALRANVETLTQARTQELGEIKANAVALTTAREAALLEERSTREALKAAADSDQKEATSAKAAFSEADEEAQRYERERSSHWERLVQELPAIKVQITSLNDQISAAEAAHSEARDKYGRLQSDARNRNAELRITLEKTKEPHRQRCDEALKRIDAAEDVELATCDSKLSDDRQKIEDEMDRLQSSRGTVEWQIKNPSASQEAIAATKDVAQRLARHQEELFQVQEVVNSAAGNYESAKRDFDRQEEQVRKARADVTAAQTSLGYAQALLTPGDGTLLAALRSSASEEWKRNLAKVINPELLGRDDLGAEYVDNATDTAFGWNINTGVLGAPEWTDDTSAREAVEAAEVRLGNAQSRLKEQQEALECIGRVRKDAELAAQTTGARLSLLRQQGSDLKRENEAAVHLVAKEQQEATKTASAELATIKNSIGELKKQRETLVLQGRDTSKKIRTKYQEQRAAAQSTRDEAIRAIGKSIGKAEEDLKATLAALDQQLDEHLGASGVDTGRLKELRADLEELQQAERDREDHKALVEGWKRWLDAGGLTRLDGLRTAAKIAAETVAASAGKLNEFNIESEKASNAYQTTKSRINARHDEVERDLQILEALDMEFGSYQAVGMATVSPSTPARELRYKVQKALQDLRALEADITRKTSILHQKLTARNSAVKELVEARLDESPEGDIVSRANALQICYKQLGPQVATDVNLTLKTLLANIGAFQKAIQAFEREVAAFNRRLQTGLSEVQCFERVKNLQLDIVTNFEGLGFYKKLAWLEDLVRQNANEVGKDYSRELPSDEAARIMGDFMSVLSNDGSVEVNLSSHITLKGSVMDNGQLKEFRRASELENISSEGLTSLILITLMTALLNTIRGGDPVHVPWVTDEVGKFDPKNFTALMQKLRDNRIDVVTASPELGPAQQAMFAQRYLFEDRGRIREYQPLESVIAASAATVASEVQP